LPTIFAGDILHNPHSARRIDEKKELSSKQPLWRLLPTPAVLAASLPNLGVQSYSQVHPQTARFTKIPAD